MSNNNNRNFLIDLCMNQLKANGFYCFDKNTDISDCLCDIGSKLGVLKPDVYGNIVHVLEAKNCESGVRGSFSNVYGLSQFPWHTDTAFWDIPCRYLLLSAESANDCPTIYHTFKSLVSDWEDFKILASKAIFKLTLPSGIRVVPFKFNRGKSTGYRYDQHIMSPYNESAKIIDAILKNGIYKVKPIEVKWTGKNAIIIDNWMGIHSRGVAVNCPDRKLYRLYID